MANWLWNDPAWPDLSYDAAVLEADFSRLYSKVGQLDGLRLSWAEGDQKRHLLDTLTIEAIQSYAIEGENLNAKAMRDSLMASLDHRNMARIGKLDRSHYFDIAAVMLDARDDHSPLTLERLHGWHRQLFQRAGTHLSADQIGAFRLGEIQVVTTNMRGEITDVHFEGPLPAQLHEGVASLIRQINHGFGGSHNGVGQAALGHLIFETLHPYADGNGRMGRILSDYMLARDPVWRGAAISMSQAIMEDQTVYYDLFDVRQNSRNGDVTAFVAGFAGLLDKAADRTIELALHITAREQYFRTFGEVLNDRQRSAIEALFERGPERLAEGISPGWYKKKTKVARNTASRDLAEMIRNGALIGPIGKGPATSYMPNVAAGGTPYSRVRLERIGALVTQLNVPEMRKRAKRMWVQLDSKAERRARPPE